MANALYDTAREGYLRGEIPWQTGSTKVAIGRGGSFNTTHKFMADVIGAGFTAVARSGIIASKTTTAGVADGDDVGFGAVPAGAALTALVIYVDNGSDATDRVIGWIDDATDLPVTPDNGTISVQWDNTANKIFRL